MRKKSRYLIFLGILVPAVLFGCGKKETEKEKPEAEPVKIVDDKTSQEKEEIVENTETKDNRNGILVALDPGHQGFHVDMSAMEPNAPGSSEMKTMASTGTAGNYTGIPEYELVLDIALKVRDELQAQGYDVILTRQDNDTAISNAQRATLANDAGADIMVRIHANSSSDSGANGALALVSSPANIYTESLYPESRRLAESVLASYCQATGMPNMGIQENDTMTGINWSTVPVMILEMGFMSNETDDRNMADAAYRENMVQGIVNGIHGYFGQTPKSERLRALEAQVGENLQEAIDAGEQWGVYVRDLSDGNYAFVGNRKMQAASLIKLYIAGAVLQNSDAMNAQQSYEGETGELLKAMISVSDNDAANTLVMRLGNGDGAAGMAVVNAFCREHGYTSTHMGRLLLASNETDDNYTSVGDCGRFLEDCKSGRLAGAFDIISYMGEQQRTTKIPAGLPEETQVANKTGELANVENDAAIVTAAGKSYILCVMSQNVQTPQAAVNRITGLSALVYQLLNS